MDVILNALTLTVNGAGQIAVHAVDWKVATGAVMVVAFAWMARLEVDDLDMRGAKPTVARH